METAEREQVRFATSDGLTLDGVRFGSGPVWVVLGHMRPSDQTSWFPFAERVAAAGHTALTYDNRGYGRSEGQAEQYRVDLDAGAAVAFARSQGAGRVFYVGASMNGTAALWLAAREDLAGIACLSAVPEFAGVDGLGSASRVAVPALFVAARDDGAKAEAALRFEEAVAGPARLVLYDAGGHGTAMFGVNGGDLTAELLDFVASNC